MYLTESSPRPPKYFYPKYIHYAANVRANVRVNVRANAEISEIFLPSNTFNLVKSVMTLSSKGVWSFRFTATPYGENTTAVCTFEPTSTNASTGRYYADAKVSGL